MRKVDEIEITTNSDKIVNKPNKRERLISDS